TPAYLADHLIAAGMVTPPTSGLVVRLDDRLQSGDPPVQLSALLAEPDQDRRSRFSGLPQGLLLIDRDPRHDGRPLTALQGTVRAPSRQVTSLLHSLKRQFASSTNVGGRHA